MKNLPEMLYVKNIEIPGDQNHDNRKHPNSLGSRNNPDVQVTLEHKIFPKKILNFQIYVRNIIRDAFYNRRQLKFFPENIKNSSSYSRIKPQLSTFIFFRNLILTLSECTCKSILLSTIFRDFSI